MKQNRFSVSNRLKSYKYAFNGLRVLFKEEHNSRIHFLATAIVIAASIYFSLNTLEWVAIIFSIGLVIAVEIINTAMENMANFLTTEKNEKIKRIKDLSAAAVLISVATAVSIGLIIFLPKIVF